jgi:ADP-ribose pyrophosphatase YjhB (NUDIX family)
MNAPGGPSGRAAGWVLREGPATPPATPGTIMVTAPTLRDDVDKGLPAAGVCRRSGRHAPAFTTSWIALAVTLACVGGTLALWLSTSQAAAQQAREEVEVQAAVVAAALARSFDGPARGLRYVSSMVSAHAPLLTATAFRSASAHIVEDGPWYAVGEVPPTVVFAPLVLGADRPAWEGAMAAVAGRPSPITQFANNTAGTSGGFVPAAPRDWYAPMAIFSIGNRLQVSMSTRRGLGGGGGLLHMPFPPPSRRSSTCSTCAPRPT